MSYALNLGCSRLPYGMRECDIGRDEAPEPAEQCNWCGEAPCVCDDSDMAERALAAMGTRCEQLARMRAAAMAEAEPVPF